MHAGHSVRCVNWVVVLLPSQHTGEHCFYCVLITTSSYWSYIHQYRHSLIESVYHVLIITPWTLYTPPSFLVLSHCTVIMMSYSGRGYIRPWASWAHVMVIHLRFPKPLRHSSLAVTYAAMLLPGKIAQTIERASKYNNERTIRNERRNSHTIELSVTVSSLCCCW